MTTIEIPQKNSGEIITFYSFKGGTGRTMTLCNIACILASKIKDKGVLMIDWDLEAPGLDKYFFKERFAASIERGSVDSFMEEFNRKPGLIDLFIELDKIITDSPLDDDETLANYALDRINFEDYITSTSIPNLSILKAGYIDENYSSKINNFHWELFYNKCPSLIRLFAERISRYYRYVLVDSRTGYTDISGICSMILPQKLVVVFTPSRQSYDGIEKLIEKATKYRIQSDDLRPLLVYPLPSRIESSLNDLRADWRYGNNEKQIPGYQPMFEDIFKKVYGLENCNLDSYFDEIQIQQNPNYAYGEEIAFLDERTKDRFSLTGSYEIFTKWLSHSRIPWLPAENQQY